MVAPNENPYNPDGVAVFADCAINIEPDATQLADIAISSAETAKKVAGIEPRVAMLSFSTKGSGNDDKFFKSVPKMQEATRLAKEAAPDLALDGEFQFDAAVVPEIAAKKAPGSEIAGYCNVLVFPDLNCGNTMYKATERLAGATAIGPLIQGLRRPFVDVSRGCSPQDIADCAAVASITEWCN